ncbi:MAG: hypothetical protein QHJ81_07160 [Anaerolineae bacterium]|nr:hypothetical protein [Anaerolineae bacterium]
MSAAKRKRQRKTRKPQPRRPSTRPAMTSAARTDNRLRERIQAFAFQPRFSEEVDPALSRFFGEEAARTRTLIADEEDFLDFQEWYFFDYLTGSGEPIIDIFAREEGPRLPEKEREFLELWRHWNRYHLFEVQKVMPGTGVIVEDLLSGETLEVHDRSASRSLRRWQLLLARPIYTDRLHFTGAAAILPPTKKDAVLTYSRQLLADFQARHPQATLDEFYQRHGLDIRQFMQRKASERPVFITPEGHPLEACTALYQVANGNAVARRLTEAEEFNYTGHSADHPGALHFAWLLRGRSHVPEQPEPQGEFFIHDVQWFTEQGSPQWRSLGDVTLWPNRLELSCLSRARLEAGKALLETLLGHLIRHHRDRIEPLETLMEPQPATPSKRWRPSPEEAEARGWEILRQQYEQWPDQPNEALGGKTPRQAVQDAQGRVRVVEMLKVIEYLQEQRRLAGQPWYDVNQTRRDLGLPIP